LQTSKAPLTQSNGFFANQSGTRELPEKSPVPNSKPPRSWLDFWERCREPFAKAKYTIKDCGLWHDGIDFDCRPHRSLHPIRVVLCVARTRCAALRTHWLVRRSLVCELLRRVERKAGAGPIIPGAQT